MSRGGRDRWSGRLEDGDRPPDVTPAQEPPASAGDRETDWTSDHTSETRDTTPALGTRGAPASWQPLDAGAEIALARPEFGDARWSYLFRRADTRYAAAEPRPGQIADANRRMRESPVDDIQGPFIKPPVWTWEVPLYFWVGGVATGASLVGLACDIAGDHRSARIARRVALGTVASAPPLLIMDLGRPLRFLNMLRIFKPRSPMNTGAWCLVGFSLTAAGGVGADLLGLRRTGRGFGGATALLGSYLGSYTGVLLAATAVPLWARSRSVLGPIFVCTAAASGAAATRLVLVGAGLPVGHPTRDALGWVETGAIAVELALSRANTRHLGQIGAVAHRGRPGALFRVAETAVTVGVATRLLGRRIPPWAHEVASVCFLGGALAFRFAWVEAGKASAVDHEAVAAMGRGRRTLAEPTEVPQGPRLASRWRSTAGRAPVRRLWSEAVRRVSLGVEALAR